MIDVDWRIAARTADRVGEGPVWFEDEQALYWVDILGRTIRRLSVATGEMESWEVPEEIGFLVPRRGRAGFVAGLRSGIFTVSLDPLAFELVVAPEPNLPDNRFNDGKADARGRLWAGTMPFDGDRPDGSLYLVDPGGACRSVARGYCVANGPAFSPDQRIVYHADSPRRTIYRFDLDDDGEPGGRQVFATFPEDCGYPDGMTVDADGFLWVAHWGGGRVSRFAPTGVVDRVLHLPVSQVTNCAFGGFGLNRLFVTTAREGRDDEELAGSLFETIPGVLGLPPCSFAG